MDANSSTISRFKAQANKFSGILSKGLSKTTSRLVKELIYGIQASKDIKVSNVARSLQEPIKLIKTEERLCRNLAADDFSEHINQQIILRLGAYLPQHFQKVHSLDTNAGGGKKSNCNTFLL
jgi:tRNA uridine 5-carbamoylmethylation protein Kti12